FLSDPETYGGGELTLDGVEGERAIKGPAGSLLIYSTGALHRVAPVIDGERQAAVGWVQSQVRRPDQREILFDLSRLRTTTPEGEPRLLLDKSIGNLLRLWGEV
ncbi:MAG: PKHD-type hydroxylase, partial [Caulobacteraceae bacterium]